MNRIKNLRLENDLSLRELASELNISYSSLGKYERGEQEPSFETLKKIAEKENMSFNNVIVSCIQNSLDQIDLTKYEDSNEKINV